MKVNTVICGDCLDELPKIPSGSVDLVLTDPPYGTTACKWDSVIPLEPMWEQLKRIIKPNGAIVMTASQPFTTTLIASNMKMFKYCWVWDKGFGKEPFATNKRPMKSHEDICVFYSELPTFNPQRTKDTPYTDKRVNQNIDSEHYIKRRMGIVNNGTREPISIINFNHSNHNQQHPTQKPVALMEYLILTYTNPGELVLDFTFGSGTTLVAAKNTGRKYIGIEKDPKYVAIAEERLSQSVLEFK